MAVKLSMTFGVLRQGQNAFKFDFYFNKCVSGSALASEEEERGVVNVEELRGACLEGLDEEESIKCQRLVDELGTFKDRGSNRCWEKAS